MKVLNESTNYEEFLRIAEEQIKHASVDEIPDTKGWMAGFAAGLHHAGYITGEELDKVHMDLNWLIDTLNN